MCSVMFRTMESSLLLILVSSLFCKISQAVRCYRCLEDKPAISPSCQFFNGSESFITDCPYSTICLKKVVALDMLNEVTVSGITERYCAPQILVGDHIKKNTSWQPIKRIYEVYTEKCDEVTQEGRPTKTILCSCRGDLCNHSFRLAGPSIVTFGLVLMLVSFNYD